MTRPDLDALEALLDKAQAMGDANTRMGTHWDGCETVHQLCMIDRLCAALTAMLSYVRELERERDQSTLNRACADDLVSAAQDMTQAAAIAMRERCAVACEESAQHDYSQIPIDGKQIPRVYMGNRCDDCAAAIRVLEP